MHRTNPSRLATMLALATALVPVACADDPSSPATSTDTSESGETTLAPEPAETSGTSTSDTEALDTSGSSSGTSDASGTTGESTGEPAETGSTGEMPPPAFEGLQACMEQLVAGSEPSGAAASVVLGDALVWAGGFGVRHPEEGGTVDEHTRFRVASVTKMMTAMAALSLVDDGSLDLDAPMGELLPPFGDPSHPEWTASLTSRQLLSHQGGFYDYLTLDGPREDEALAEAVLGQIFTNVPFLVEPGAMWNYSNPNYSVAGLAVEQAAGVPYRAVVEQRVFAPLGMTRSTFDVDVVEADGNYAVGIVGEQRFGATDYDNAWGRPAGYAWASAEDLGRLARLLLRGDEAVLSAAAHQQLVTPELDTRLFLDRVHYGLGLFHYDFIPTDAGFLEIDNFDHGGNLPGYTTLVHVVPELDVAMAIVGNGDVLDLYPCVVAALGDLPGFELQPVVPDTEAELTVLEDYVGSYADPAFVVGDFSIALEGDALQVSFPVLDQFDIPYAPTLQLVSRDNFVVEIQGIPFPLTGLYGEGGALQYVRTRLFVGERASVVRPQRIDPARTLDALQRLRWDEPTRTRAIAAATRAR